MAFAAAVAVATPTVAGGHRRDRPHDARAAVPVKDCTRFNGRWGYYGNPWCTAQEQRAFDLWDARRHRALQ